MRAVDPNVLVRLLTADDARQAAAAESFVAAGEVWISHVVLVETIWVLDSVHGRGRSEIAAAIETLLDHESLVLQDADVVEQALRLFRRSRAVGFSDCVVLDVARKAGHLPLGTFDKRLGAPDGAERI